MAEVTITDLSRHEGIIAFSEREAKIITSQHFHLHIVDLEKFESSFTTLKYTIHQFERHNFTEPYRKMLDIRTKQISDNYNQLKPIRRQKRGILNPLGTFIKSITGNLNDNDLQLIRQAIKNSKIKTNSLTDNDNRQIRINQQFETKINDLIQHDNENQIEVLRRISNIVNNANAMYENHLKGIVHDIFLNLDLLNNQLRDIFEIIQLSRIGILSRAILNDNETEFILEKLEKQNIPINNIDQIYEFLSIETHHENSKMIFIIKIPIFLSEHFQYIKFETLPFFNRTISTFYNLAVLSKTQTFAVKNDCTIVENYRICKRQEIVNITGDGCIDNALQGINASCPYEEHRNEMDIKPIDDHTLIIRNAVQPVLLDSDCNIKSRQIAGTLLFSYPNCSVSINGIEYDDRKTTDYHNIKTISTIGVNFQPTVVLNKPDLQQVNLLRIANLDHITKLRRDHTTLQHTTTGFLILFVAMTLGIAIRTMKKQLGWCITQRETSAEKTQHLQLQQNTQKFIFTTTKDHISNSNIPVGIHRRNHRTDHRTPR
ncbi:uncharacterized protein LOC129728013 [Wyeomyia smithii]|uniref:uncharacterized protein LOC129728013 n=1 Tax=Wyeomyia smithii TaxID=174621 RepID=UPI0024681425|nr:uncharacterized protein LOC129728013 [Wyeomyia smithii]